MATQIGKLSAPIGTIKIPVEIDVFATVDGERMRIGSAESELALSVTPASSGVTVRGGTVERGRDRVECDGPTKSTGVTNVTYDAGLPVEMVGDIVSRRLRETNTL